MVRRGFHCLPILVVQRRVDGIVYPSAMVVRIRFCKGLLVLVLIGVMVLWVMREDPGSFVGKRPSDGKFWF